LRWGGRFKEGGNKSAIEGVAMEGQKTGAGCFLTAKPHSVSGVSSNIVGLCYPGTAPSVPSPWSGNSVDYRIKISNCMLEPRTPFRES